MPLIRTITCRAEAEIPKIKGSRFFGFVDHAPDAASATEHLAAARATWPDATHHCWAWRGIDGTTRSSDDGEPSGTGGPPILQRITGADLAGVVVIVMRYYGGTKLGTGGLVRAYGETATAILAEAEVVEQAITQRVSLRFGYGDSGPVQSVLHAEGLEATDTTYDSEVCMTLRVPVEAVDGLVEALIERTAGRCQVEVAEP